MPMKSQKVNERTDAVLECDVNDKDADVEWWHDGVKIKIDGKKYKAERAGRKRKLFINCALLEDAGEHKCTTKDDQTYGNLFVERN